MKHARRVNSLYKKRTSNYRKLIIKNQKINLSAENNGIDPSSLCFIITNTIERTWQTEQYTISFAIALFRVNKALMSTVVRRIKGLSRTGQKNNTLNSRLYPRDSGLNRTIRWSYTAYDAKNLSYKRAFRTLNLTRTIFFTNIVNNII